MKDLNRGRIHELKKKVRLLSSELDKMQTEPTREAEHYEMALDLSRWAIRELNELFPPCETSLNEFEFESGVLIDDYSIFADVWNDAGIKVGKHVTHYLSESKFIQDLHRFDKSTFLYIDWYLMPFGNSYDFIRRLSEEYEFQNIIVTTDEMGLRIEDMPWVKAIISKDPPWNREFPVRKAI